MRIILRKGRRALPLRPTVFGPRRSWPPQTATGYCRSARCRMPSSHRRTTGPSLSLPSPRQSDRRDCGVPAGAIKPHHELVWKPTKPDSATIGTSGACGARVAPGGNTLTAFFPHRIFPFPIAIFGYPTFSFSEWLVNGKNPRGGPTKSGLPYEWRSSHVIRDQQCHCFSKIVITGLLNGNP
jgi:hypothetical protein